MDNQQQVAQSYNVRAMPTFLILRNGRQTSRIEGADPGKLQDAVRKLAAEAESADSSSAAAADGGAEASGSGGTWSGAKPPRGYGDVTDQIDISGLELLNADSEMGGVRTLFAGGRPSGLAASGDSKGKTPATSSATTKDWVESDTDEQLLLFIPFMATLKIHTLQLTSLPSSTADDADVQRPKTIRLFVNRTTNLSFDDAADIDATQELSIPSSAWDAKTGTASVELRFVKFQKCSSLVLFVVDAEHGGDRTRIDRVRVVGEAGIKRDLGKLEKIGDDS